MKIRYRPDLVRPLLFLSLGSESSHNPLYSSPPLSMGFTVLPISALPTTRLPTIRHVRSMRHASRMSVGFSHLPASSKYNICSFSPSYALLVVFFQLITVLRASPRWDVLLFFVMRFDGSRKANSIRGLVVPSWIGLKKKG